MLTRKLPATARPLPPDTRPRGGSFARSAGSFVPKLTSKVFERYGFHSAEIMTAWTSVAGGDVAAVSAPERLHWPRGGARQNADESGSAPANGATLVLRVEPAHAIDISYRTGEILDRINRYFGYRAVATLKILQAPLARGAETQRPTANSGAASAVAPPPQLPEIADEALKEALTGLWNRVAAENARD
ncbi:MAG: DUF721 domain-containing protein [Hyphomicrobium sp.]